MPELKVQIHVRDRDTFIEEEYGKDLLHVFHSARVGNILTVDCGNEDNAIVQKNIGEAAKAYGLDIDFVRYTLDPCHITFRIAGKR